MREMYIHVEQLNVKYGDFYAVKDVSFQMFKGEILALMGPNGSGKTSMIECIEGLRKPYKGKIEVFGMHPQTNRKQIYKDMGIQLQNADYPEKIKVRELCRLFASFYENPADWTKLLQYVGLFKKQHCYIGKLSGGERQRLSILLALLPKPKILILDELTTGLDVEIRHEIWESLKEIKKKGTSILLVSHYIDEIEYLADRLLFLKEGVLHFSGTKNEFCSYAKKQLSLEAQKKHLTFEELYLSLLPQTTTNLEDIL